MPHTHLTESQNKNTLTLIFFLEKIFFFWIFFSLDPADSKRSIAGSKDKIMKLVHVFKVWKHSLPNIRTTFIRSFLLPQIMSSCLLACTTKNIPCSGCRVFLPPVLSIHWNVCVIILFLIKNMHLTFLSAKYEKVYAKSWNV